MLRYLGPNGARSVRRASAEAALRVRGNTCESFNLSDGSRKERLDPLRAGKEGSPFGVGPGSTAFAFDQAGPAGEFVGGDSQRFRELTGGGEAKLGAIALLNMADGRRIKARRAGQGRARNPRLFPEFPDRSPNGLCHDDPFDIARVYYPGVLSIAKGGQLSIILRHNDRVGKPVT